MDILPEINTWNDVVSIVVGIVAILIVNQRIFNGYFIETNPSPIKRFSISLLCGFLVGILICFTGVIIELLKLIDQNSLWNIYSSSIGLITALSGSDLKSLKSILNIGKKVND